MLISARRGSITIAPGAVRGTSSGGHLPPNISKTELEQPRTQAEFRAWVDATHDAFGASADGKRALRLNHGGLVKQFMEEVWPLALFADAFYENRTDVVFKPVIGSQSHDALVLDADSRAVRMHVQITQAIDGEQSKLRMLHLEEHGRAPLTGVRLTRKRGQPIAQMWPDAVDHEVALRESFDRTLSAIRKKASSRFAYERNTALVVEFDDASIHSDDDRAAFKRFAQSQVLQAVSHFTALYLVSDRARLSYCIQTG